LSFLLKPIQTKEVLEAAIERLRDVASRATRELLVVTADRARQEEVLGLLNGGVVRPATAGSGREALERLRQQPVDCLVIDPDLPDMTAEHFASELALESAWTDLPLLVYGRRELGTNGSNSNGPLTSAANVRTASSPERLLDLATLALHCPVAQLPDARRQTLSSLHQTDKVLADKKILVVDDDIRNIFALTSILERHGMLVVPAETGREAIEALQTDPAIDIVLMDIMMPEMDGMDTMRAIRQLPQFKALPIIAVTAKAMKGDREKCIEAGAWDYLSKPVDTEQMLAVLRAWLLR
jgi:CheY-like chemotaxis protein